MLGPLGTPTMERVSQLSLKGRIQFVAKLYNGDQSRVPELIKAVGGGISKCSIRQAFKA